ncbi:MAG: flagellar biosynthesis anti-sigma factor FlgM [Bryobacteraceae bacterium]|nr:flagellar biosynthesis anti-sigma factor FlgM [Bryobacteraceae bacterium]
MKVNDPNLNPLAGGSVGSSERAGQAEHIRRGGPGGRYDGSLDDSPDRVALSSLSAQVRALGADSSERISRLERLSADVRSGRYQVDAAAVSRSLVEQSLKPKE